MLNYNEIAAPLPILTCMMPGDIFLSGYLQMDSKGLEMKLRKWILILLKHIPENEKYLLCCTLNKDLLFNKSNLYRAV